MKRDLVRVPFSLENDASKTICLPKCPAKSLVKIWPKESDGGFADYWMALAPFSSMKKTRFQRASSEVNFEIVKCEAKAFVDARCDVVETELSTNG